MLGNVQQRSEHWEPAKRSLNCSHNYTRRIGYDAKGMTLKVCSKIQYCSNVRFREQTRFSNAEISTGRFDAAHSATLASTNTYLVATPNSCRIPAVSRTRLEPQKFDYLSFSSNVLQTSINTARKPVDIPKIVPTLSGKYREVLMPQSAHPSS